MQCFLGDTFLFQSNCRHVERWDAFLSRTHLLITSYKAPCPLHNFDYSFSFNTLEQFFKPIKGKVVPVLFIKWAPRHESLSVLDGGEWSASRPGRFTAREGAPCAHWIEGWVGLRVCLDAVVKGKIPILYRDSKPWPSSPWPSVVLLYHGSSFKRKTKVNYKKVTSVADHPLLP